MKEGLLFLLTLMMIGCGAGAQTKGKLTISVSAGAAVPVGVFAKKDMESAAIYFQDREPPAVMGIAKSESGFAKLGYSYNAMLSYGFSNHFYTFVRSGKSVNPISVIEIDDFLNDLYGVEQRFSHVDNELFTVSPGLGYSYHKGNWQYNAGIFAGYGKCNYPYFESLLVYTGSNIIWAHSGEMPDLSSLVSGALINLNYGKGRFRTGVEILYQQANFNYNMLPRTIPGGSQSENYDDTLKSRIVEIGLQISYFLGSSDK
ncbi:hypothetical protein [Algoriphagus sp. NG3]|uniref:hypothetical protein n=1 Tax=unclassified Algoriphagus TaxID=2641541 RepID=UPI002A816706|nr:hypothetical protein [Algoriphagus sp. NG3]WPR76060.1 hypothetical protein SLW71_01690 [Algoriphagus sp. NG3]